MHLIAIRLCGVVVAPRAFLGISLLFITIVGPLTASAQQPTSPLYWTIREDALFSSQWRLNAADGTTMEILPGRALVAMLEAERRISAQYNINPKLLITNTPGLNAFASEANGQTLVVVYADIISVIGDDVNVWAALFGHEFAHLYLHHSSAKETRAAILAFIAAAVNAYERQKGRDRSDLVNFGASIVGNTFSREQEREADATGVRFMADAGFDPQGAIRLQELLITHVGSSGVLSFLSTHPSGEARISSIKQIIATLPAASAPAAEFSLQDFKQWMILCSSDAREGNGNPAPNAGVIQQCLRKHDAEMANRYGLCVVDLNARGVTNGFDPLLGCAAQSPKLRGFSYDVWAQYCSGASLTKGEIGLITAKPTQQCVWDGDPQMAFRGALCEAETNSTQIPSDKWWPTVRSCSLDSSDETKRFTRKHWKLACNRMGDYAAPGAADRDKVIEDCLAQGPAADATESTRGAKELYDEATRAWAKYSATPTGTVTPPINDCDRLASTQGLPSIAPVYVGFIEAPAAERACLDAIKTSSDPSRFQANLAGVYLQQGRFADALLLARTAAKRNAVNSSTVMADMYDHGLGVPLSPDKVIPLLLADVEWGSVWALDYLGDLLTSGRRVERSPALGLELYKLAASNGSAEAAFDAAGVYLAGNGVEADVPQALKILRAAGDGYPPVLNPLSRALRATPGSDPDESRRAIAKLFQQMEHFAALGSLTAKYRLGLIYTNGVGVSVDKEKGFSLLMEAAQAGDPNAAFSVANAYLNGTGTAPNQEKAIEFFRKAAASGILDAEIQLAKLTNSAR